MYSTGGDPAFLRRFNSSAVLRALYDQAAKADPDSVTGLTVSQLAAAVNVSRPTAEEAADVLLAAGWVEELGPQPGPQRSAGRPARRYSFRPSSGCVVGVDVDATAVSAIVSDLGGTVLGRERRSASPRLSAGRRIDLIARTVQAALDASGADRGPVQRGVAGTSGIVDAEGRVVRSDLPGWEGLALADEIARILDAPASAHNHLRLGAVGERWRGAAIGADDVVHLHTGERTGLGVVVNGRPLLGAHGAAGDVAPAVAEAWARAHETLLKHPLGARSAAGSATGTSGDGRAIFDAAAGDDASARSAVEAYARAVIDEVAHVIVAFDPAVVVIGGDLARAGDAAIEPVRGRLDASGTASPEVRASVLGDDAAALGAIRSALDELESRLFEEPYQLDRL